MFGIVELCQWQLLLAKRRRHWNELGAALVVMSSTSYIMILWLSMHVTVPTVNVIQVLLLLWMLGQKKIISKYFRVNWRRRNWNPPDRMNLSRYVSALPVRRRCIQNIRLQSVFLCEYIHSTILPRCHLMYIYGLDPSRIGWTYPLSQMTSLSLKNITKWEKFGNQKTWIDSNPWWQSIELANEVLT